MSQRCAIWGTPAEVWQVRDHDAYGVRSPRAGGDYEITGTAAEFVRNLDEQSKARLTTAIINSRSDGSDTPRVDSNLLEASKIAPTLTYTERALRLLGYIADRESFAPGESHPSAPMDLRSPLR